MAAEEVQGQLAAVSLEPDNETSAKAPPNPAPDSEQAMDGSDSAQHVVPNTATPEGFAAPTTLWLGGISPEAKQEAQDTLRTILRGGTTSEKEVIYLLLRLLEPFVDTEEPRLELPKLKSRERRIAHKVGDVTGLQRFTDGQTIYLLRGASVDFAALRELVDEVESSQQSRPKMRLMRRKDADDDDGSLDASQNSDGTSDAGSRRVRTLSQREQEYEEARARIFREAEEEAKAQAQAAAMAALQAATQTQDPTQAQGQAQTQPQAQPQKQAHNQQAQVAGQRDADSTKEGQQRTANPDVANWNGPRDRQTRSSHAGGRRGRGRGYATGMPMNAEGGFPGRMWHPDAMQAGMHGWSPAQGWGRGYPQSDRQPPMSGTFNPYAPGFVPGAPFIGDQGAPRASHGHAPAMAPQYGQRSSQAPQHMPQQPYAGQAWPSSNPMAYNMPHGNFAMPHASFGAPYPGYPSPMGMRPGAQVGASASQAPGTGRGRGNGRQLYNPKA
ncbi:uncharacterized protein MONBRDRAFT_29042 [Monosiga brevicollis MX1]|uniref:SUZ domain-containing protein n=1 Tax=Monosiga brevicollis TaxID=81824 RepID=A9V9Y2_MONBE|nr:uncharacterized protein MONBRDRAFT_29042 [Monosiga brevicollis MX1]EDQ85637.1 predicted protein [Monosiga brevicollis MX1]|eukprot:XP_001749586.1 hypothetical protein [Monosiga brevicollis MX1]